MRAWRPSAGVLLLAIAAACVGPVVPTATTPPPTPSPSPEPIAATQADVFGAIGRWMVTQQRAALGDFVYVDIGLDAQRFDAAHVAELRGAGPAAFGDTITDGSQVALLTALLGVIIQFVPDPQAVRDRAGPDIFGCKPYLGGRSMIHLSAPLPRHDDPSRFYVGLDIDAGCQGQTFLLEVGRTGDGYGVLRVVQQGGWIV